MKTLIVDDNFNNRILLQKLLAHYGDCEVAVNGEEAVEAFLLAHADGEPYDLICMDIMMPEMDGKKATKIIRDKETELGIKGRQEVKILMVTALDSPKEVIESFYQCGCTDYIVKPVTQEKLEGKLRQYGLSSVIDLLSEE